MLLVDIADVDDDDDDEEEVVEVVDFAASAAAARACSTNVGNILQNVGFARLNCIDCIANCRRLATLVSIEPNVGVSSTINDSRPIKIELTLHKTFQVSG